MPVEPIAGARINLERKGDGEPALIFAHGFACDLHDRDAQKIVAGVSHFVHIEAAEAVNDQMRRFAERL